MKGLIQTYVKKQTLLLLLGFCLVTGQAYGQSCDGGTVQTENGQTMVEICKDGQPDFIHFDSMNVSGNNFRYIITDVNDTILNVKTADMQNFNGAPAGECHVYGFAYDGNLQNANMGNHVSDVSATNCDSLSSNYITVIRNQTDGGMVQTEAGMDTAQICKNSNPSVIHFDSMNVTGSNFHYIITNANDEVLNVKSQDMQNFNGAPVGECHVYGISFKGDLQDTAMGTPIQQVSATICDSLSRNYITVIRNQTDGGMVQTEAGMDTAQICKNSNPSVIHFDSMNVTGSNFHYIITNANDEVLNVKSQDMQNFNGAPVGECHVYGISFKGNLQDTAMGTPIQQVSATICDSLSRNYITVIRNQTDGGMVQTEAGMDTVDYCLGVSNMVDFDSMNVSGSNYRYVITNAHDTVLNPDAPNRASFDKAPPGECHVWGVAYKGNLNIQEGMHIDQVNGSICDSLSRNYITILRDTIVGGTVETANGEDSIEIIIDDEADMIDFMTSSETMMNNYRYIITDANDSILNPDAGTSQNFNPAGTGECHVYGVAYQGDLNANKNMAIADISATECMERSDNYIVVNRVDDSTTSIAESRSTSNNLSLYPNPAKEQVQVDINSQEQGQAQLKVIDVSGQTVIQQNVTLKNGNNSVNLSLSEEMRGTYILSLQHGDQIHHQKLLVK